MLSDLKVIKHINKEDLNKKITLLTNSLVSTPNLPAFAGYLNHRKQIVDNIDVLEIISKDSIHAKAFLFNKDLVAIGSFNLDPRSIFLSSESMVVIHSEEVVNKFGLNIHNFANDSLLVNKDYNYNKESPIKPTTSKKLMYNLFSYIIKPLENLL